MAAAPEISQPLKICPINGLKQHSGECWHDAIATSLIFTDNIGDLIQYIFNNNKIDDIISRLRENTLFIPYYYKPFNINDENIDRFIDDMIEYVTNLHTIYTNIKTSKYSGKKKCW